MRCTKCGNITWDHLSVCNACGNDLSTVIEELGRFFECKKGFSWFEGFSTGADLKKGATPVDLSSIDVSDLTPEAAKTEHERQIAMDEIEEAVDDEELQKALDEVIE